MNTLERRLRKLEQHAEAADSQVFVIFACGDRSFDELREHLGILDRPGRELLVISQVIVRPGPRPDGPLPENVSPFASGN